MKALSVRVDTKAARRILQGGAAVDRVMDQALRTSGFLVQREVVRKTPVDTGVLRGSIHTRVYGTALARVAEIGTAVRYAEAVEEGRKPGKQPPLSAIEPWVVRNLRVAAISKRTGKRRKRKLATNETRSAAYLVARAIGRRGTTGRFMFRDALKATEPMIRRIFQRAERNLARELGGE